MTGTMTRARARPRAQGRKYVYEAHERGRNADLRRQLDALEPGNRDYKQVIKLILKLNNANHAVKHKGVSFKTRHERKIFFDAFFYDLRRETIYRNIEPRRLKEDHVEAMTLVWEARDLSAGTIANYLSYLRTWCQWTNRPPETVRDAAYYFGEDSPLAHRRQVAEYDHSWIAAGIDHADVLPRIVEICPYVAIQTEFSLELAFRPKEARCVRPHEAVIPISDAIVDDIPEGCEATHCVRVQHGTKGDRVFTEGQHGALLLGAGQGRHHPQACRHQRSRAAPRAGWRRVPGRRRRAASGARRGRPGSRYRPQSAGRCRQTARA